MWIVQQDHIRISVLVELLVRPELESSMMTSVQTASPKPEEEDSLSAREEESTWSCDRPSISGMESSEDGTEES